MQPTETEIEACVTDCRLAVREMIEQHGLPALRGDNENELIEAIRRYIKEGILSDAESAATRPTR